MQQEELIFKSVKEFIDTIENLKNTEKKTSAILDLIKSLVEYLEAERNICGSQSELLHLLNQSMQANIKLSAELNRRITQIENKLAESESMALYLMCKA